MRTGLSCLNLRKLRPSLGARILVQQFLRASALCYLMFQGFFGLALIT